MIPLSMYFVSSQWMTCCFLVFFSARRKKQNDIFAHVAKYDYLCRNLFENIKTI